MATSLTLIVTIKLTNRNANNKCYRPQHARKISEKGLKIKSVKVVEGKRATRLSLLRASTGRIWGKGEEPLWSRLIPVFIGPAREGKPLLHTGWVSSHGERKGCVHNRQGQYMRHITRQAELQPFASTSFSSHLCLLRRAKTFKSTLHIQTVFDFTLMMVMMSQI